MYELKPSYAWINETIQKHKEILMKNNLWKVKYKHYTLNKKSEI